MIIDTHEPENIDENRHDKKKGEQLKNNGRKGIKTTDAHFSPNGKINIHEHYVDLAQMGTFISILEGLWNGIVVSGVITICVILVRSASALFLA